MGGVSRTTVLNGTRSHFHPLILKGMVSLRARAPIPIATGEALYTAMGL